MKNTEYKNNGLTIDDLYEKDLISALVSYSSASRKFRRAQIENGASIWDFPSTWIKILVVALLILIRIACR